MSDFLGSRRLSTFIDDLAIENFHSVEKQKINVRYILPAEKELICLLPRTLRPHSAYHTGISVCTVRRILRLLWLTCWR